MEEENKKKEEQEKQIKEQVKKEVEEQKSNNKDININVNNNTKPDSVVIVKETIPSSVYYSNSYIFPQSSDTYLSKGQIQSLSNYELGIARNEIYARHGYIFKLEQFRRYFESQNWYVPRYSSESSINLNSVEIYNVDLIKKEEDRRGIKW
ncbi:YARHG domain-containing protein [Clostridium sp. SM-530-WT-3G]|nr:YARHG domain-containing protein [Clostridium sp. SM-530-WT-3G]